MRQRPYSKELGLTGSIYEIVNRKAEQKTLHYICVNEEIISLLLPIGLPTTR